MRGTRRSRLGSSASATLAAIGDTPLPVDLVRAAAPEVEVLATMKCMNPTASRKDRPVLRILG